MKEWFINKKRLANYVPSAAEIKVCKALDSLNVEYYQEVSFNGCRSYNNGLLIFDFIVPSKRVLIEYDGPHHQTNIHTIENDLIKNKFAEDFGYKLLRFNKDNWNTLSEDIKVNLNKCRNEKKKSDMCPKGERMSMFSRKKRFSNKRNKSVLPITIDVYEDMMARKKNLDKISPNC